MRCSAHDDWTCVQRSSPAVRVGDAGIAVAVGDAGLIAGIVAEQDAGLAHCAPVRLTSNAVGGRGLLEREHRPRQAQQDHQPCPQDEPSPVATVALLKRCGPTLAMFHPKTGSLYPATNVPAPVSTSGSAAALRLAVASFWKGQSRDLALPKSAVG
jgi:hypothetical protein